MKKQFVAFIVSVLLLCPAVLFSQEKNSTLVLKERGTKKITGTIFISDRNGKKNPTPEQFSKDKYLNLFIQPSQGNLLFKFTKRDADTIRTYLTLQQAEKVALPVSVEPVTKSFPTKEFLGVVLSFDKTNVDIAKPFVFYYQNRKSDPITLPEKYWLGFNSYYKNLKAAKESLEKDPVKALQLLSVFTPSDSVSMTFSFSTEARELFLATANNYLMTLRNTVVELYNKNVESYLDEDDLNELKELEVKWAEDVESIGSMFHADITDEAPLKLLIEDVDLQFATLHASFATKVLYDYTYDEYKYELFVTLIAKLMIEQYEGGYLQKLRAVKTEDIEKFKQEVNDLKQFQFYDEFKQLITLVNSNIKAGTFVLSPEVMLRLKNMRNDQPYPNYEILNAFNALAADNTEMFLKGLEAVQDATSDQKLIEDVSNWKVSGYYVTKKIDRNLILRISDATKLLDQNQIGKASKEFELAYKLNRRLPVTLYYIGYTYYLQGQEYTGIKFFRKALEINPTAMMPYIKELDFYLQENQLELASERVEVALQKRPKNWYLLSQKAKVLVGLNKLNEAEHLIIEKMIPISPSIVEQYFLLGDIYAQKGEFSRARDTYNIGGDLDPTNAMFEEKMRELEEIEKQGSLPSSKNEPVGKVDGVEDEAEDEVEEEVEDEILDEVSPIEE